MGCQAAHQHVRITLDHFVQSKSREHYGPAQQAYVRACVRACRGLEGGGWGHRIETVLGRVAPVIEVGRRRAAVVVGLDDVEAVVAELVAQVPHIVRLPALA